MVTHRNSKFIFYHLNNYLSQINKPLKFIRHTVISDDDLTLDNFKKKIDHIL